MNGRKQALYVTSRTRRRPSQVVGYDLLVVSIAVFRGDDKKPVRSHVKAPAERYRDRCTSGNSRFAGSFSVSALIMLQVRLEDCDGLLLLEISFSPGYQCNRLESTSTTTVPTDYSTYRQMTKKTLLEVI